MKTVKFTKGPWTHSDDSWAHGSFDINSEPEGWYSLATVVAEHDCGTPNDEGLANVHLIAAAPELYDALIRVQQEGGMGIGLHRQIDRVLAKARGEAK